MPSMLSSSINRRPRAATSALRSRTNKDGCRLLTGTPLEPILLQHHSIRPFPLSDRHLDQSSMPPAHSKSIAYERLPHPLPPEAERPEVQTRSVPTDLLVRLQESSTHRA